MKYRLVGKRFVQVFVLSFLILLGLYAVQGQEIKAAAQDALMWSGIASGLFTAAGIYRARKNITCALCDELPRRDAIGS